MEPWQVYDASTPELLSELSRIRSEDVREVSRLARLSVLIEQELAERGHLILFLDSLTVETPPSKAVLPPAVTEDKAARAAFASPDTAQTADLLSCLSGSYLRPSHGLLDDSFQHLNKCTDLASSSVSIDTACKAPSASTASPTTAPCLSNHEQPDINSFVEHNSQAAGPSVLEAAIAAYKEEKRQLWKARKAGAQAGWGFANSSWPKPDIKARSTLGPLRMSAKHSSLAQPQTRSASLEGATAQPAQRQQQDKQQADVLQQPWPQADTPPAATCTRHDHAAALLQHMHPTAASQRDIVPAQACAAAAAELFSRAEFAKAQTAEARDCLITDTAQCSNQAYAQYDAVDSLLPSPAQHSLHTVNSLSAAASLSARPAASSVAELDQLANLPSHFIDGSQDADEDRGKPQYQCGGDEAVQLSAAAQIAEDIQATSLSHKQLTNLQTAGSGSVLTASSHTNSGGCSESDSEGESGAAAAEVSVEQSHWLPPHFFCWQDVTSRHNDLGLSFDYPSKQDPEDGPESSSHVGEEDWTARPDQKGTAAAAASSDQQVMSHRLSDWSMHSEDGLCSWPSTPLHDLLSRESSTRRVPMMNSKQASKGVRKLQTVRKSWGSDAASFRDRFSVLPQGERLMLA
ncbi:TPA: hypothetical protein ACH3X1_004244 [Trebouxia sp. C0004]